MLLEAKDVHKHYDTPKGKLEVLRGINLSLDKGEVAFILGRSGAGKSTLLHVLGSLDQATKGKVTFDGTEITSLKEKKLANFRNKKIGFLFQFYHLLPELTLLENVLMPAMMARDRKKRDHAKHLLNMTGLSERADHYPHELSGGEQQRAALARALVNDPEIVFCDEPTGNLDEETADKVFKLILDLNWKTKQTFCVVTHEESLVEEQKSVYWLHDGRLQKRT